MTVEEVLLEKVKVLPMNRKQEVLDFAEFLEQKEAVKRPRRSMKGALADLHINITARDQRSQNSSCAFDSNDLVEMKCV